MSEEWKKKAAARALELEVWRKSKVIGIGTGSTVSYLVDLLPSEYIEDKIYVTSSWDTLIRLRDKGAVVAEPMGVGRLDLYVDGADAVDFSGNLVKGGGAALLREKILASMSDIFVVIADQSKRTEDLRSRPIPLVVSPYSLSYVMERLDGLGLKPRLRLCRGGKWGLVSTEEGQAVIDVDASRWKVGLEELEISLKRIPGVLETGLFLGMADILVLGGKETIVERLR